MSTSNLLTALVLAAATGTAACTISLAKVFSPARVWVARKAARAGGGWRWLSDLISCPYCVSHWLAFAATAVYRPVLVEVWPPLDLLVTAFAIVAAATGFVLVIRRAIQPLRIQLDHPAPDPQPPRRRPNGQISLAPGQDPSPRKTP